MLTFANPAALLALLGLLVPLAIHLWNRRPGRVVPVGALRWLTAGANRRMRQLHLTQWPLLLLRLLLLAVLAAALAGPRWQQPPRPARPQVLVAPAVLASPAWPLLRPRVDSLRRRGAELRAFAAGFPLLPDSAAERAAVRQDSAARSGAAADWYWPRAAEAADSFPGQPLHVFTPATLAHFQGSRPALPARLHWQLVPPDSATQTWLQAAARPTPDSLRLTVGRGDAGRIRFRTEYRVTANSQPLRVAGLPPLQLNQSRKGAVIRPLTDSGAALPVSGPLRIGVAYEASRRDDARYLRAALRAAASALPAGYELQEQVLPAADFRADSLDWLFWLAEAAPSATVAQRVPQGLTLLRDAAGPGTATTSIFTSDAQQGITHELQRIVAAPASAAVLWTDAQARPVLTLNRRGRGREYQLLTRLHPQWSSLPTDGRLPEVLLALLAPDSTPVTGPDPRRLDAAQLLGPAAKPATVVRPRPAARFRDLRPWVALAAGLLFALERVLAARRPAPTA
ncbi:hypothetical protein EJV47_03185 [Hymenobacter gummosus]|uniref:Aerotolerance regulator N-terminal domain-containing protein n=1 Tax=Hymenobacter gummosus TaxID=1776032 RepID=A0A431UA59_9BACT|nr:BatA domain-containing protein [Hymenobacter gummosus]RTQ53752.1 hypothetical protein EJV47_03185 [Hymenobacter gummosus]